MLNDGKLRNVFEQQESCFPISVTTSGDNEKWAKATGP
jgi:hypothetical protein